MTPNLLLVSFLVFQTLEQWRRLHNEIGDFVDFIKIFVVQ